MPEYTFDHIHLMTPDPVKTVNFYKKMFGATVVSEQSLPNGRVIVDMRLGGVTFLVSKSTGENAQRGLVHFGIRADNLEKAVSELKSKGVQFTKEPTQINPHFKVSFLLAPEDVPVELQEGTI